MRKKNRRPSGRRKFLGVKSVYIAKIVKKDPGRLLLVDGISSVCSIPLQTDEWECDVVVSASQKGWMLPPGLAFISFSPLAWKFNSISNMPRFYFDLIQYKSYYDKGQLTEASALSAFDYINLSAEYFYKNDYYEAMIACKMALDIEPNMYVALAQLGSVYYMMEYYEDAIVMYEKALEINPEATDIQIVLADLKARTN